MSDTLRFTDHDLPLLKRKFAEEVKRNLFEAYLQPRRTTVNLVSTSTSSSAAFPGGEAFDFCFSPNGHWTLGLSSSRIYVLDTASADISVKRELKVLRKPVAAAILDDGATLVVLSSDHKANIYDLTDQGTKHVRSVSFDNSPHAIALTPKGEILATAFQGGVELHSLAPNAGDISGRTIKCDRVDALTFSSDGTTLLGTTRNSRNPSTVILTAPYLTEENQDLPVSDHISHIWTSQIIFPNSSRDCSHAALLSNRSDGDANWTFTFDQVFESFRTVRTDDLRNGTTYFTGPRRPRRPETEQSKINLTPCTLPAPNSYGDLVAAGFLGKDLWLYGVPEGLDIPSISQMDDPSSGGSGVSTPNSLPRSPATSYTRGEAAELIQLPKWQVLVDKYRNVFAKGRMLAEIPGVTALCWVDQKPIVGGTTLRERLIVAALGGLSANPELDQDGLASVDGGRLIVLDFDLLPKNGESSEITFEVGNVEPELLEEDRIDMDREVELVRRRTRKEPSRLTSTVADALASSSSRPPLPPTLNAIADIDARDQEQSASQSDLRTGPAETSHFSETADFSLEEASEVFDRPYSHTQPRSRTSLHRSATAVAANRERNPPRIGNEASVVYRRADGRGELPHESDADNWVPPPPPYKPKADIPLPEHLRQSIMPRPACAAHRARNSRERPRRATTMYESNGSRDISSSQERSSRQRLSHQISMNSRSVSESLDRLSGPVTPIGSPGFSSHDEQAQLSPIARQSTTSSRRPVSAYVGHIAHSLRRSSNPRLRSTTSDSSDGVPPVPSLPRQHDHTTSLPPMRTSSPISPMTSPDASLQQRLSQPLPPPPSNESSPDQSVDLSSIPSMPSAQQLANLSNRYRQPPTSQSNRRPPSSLNTSGNRIPAPPRGAMGAAGNPSSPTQITSPARTLSSRSSSAAQSSPALLRPTAKRLDTIESVTSSIMSQRRSRSRGMRSAGSGRRSQSVGPALRLDRVNTTGQDESRGKGVFGVKKRRGREGELGEHKEKEGKGGRCAVM